MPIASVIRGNKNKPQELKNDPWAKLQVFNVSGRFTYDPKEGGGKNSFNGVYGETPLERATLFRPQT